MSHDLTVTITDRLAIEAIEVESHALGITPEILVTSIVMHRLRDTDRKPEASAAKVAALVAEGYHDVDIAILLGLARTTVARKRQNLGLAANRLNAVSTRKIRSTR